MHAEYKDDDHQLVKHSSIQMIPSFVNNIRSNRTNLCEKNYDNDDTENNNNNNNENNTNDSNQNNDLDERNRDVLASGDERTAITSMKANVDDCSENRRDREKGEREKREDNKKRTTTLAASTREEEEENIDEREKTTQANQTTDSVTSFTSEQHSCPSVVRLSVDDSMAHRVSSSSFNRNNQLPPTVPTSSSSSNTRSSRSTYTTHTFASTNTFASPPTYTNASLTGDPRTLHSYYVASSNYRPPPPSPAQSLTRHYREYEPSYPSITRYRTPSSSSPYRKTHYLDESDEEIINEEILEITDLNHYPTLIERWGDDTKTVVRQEGELKIEDFVEFEEIEPTIVEEILYELVYSGDQLKTCRQIHRSRSESRNFRKIKKRRTKRKIHPSDDSSYITSEDSSRANSGSRSPYRSQQQQQQQQQPYVSSDRSPTPTQSPSSSWQSTGFLSGETVTRPSLDLSIRNDRNYVNSIRVNESEPLRSYAQVPSYSSRTLENETIDRRSSDLLDEMRLLSSRINDLVDTNDEQLKTPTEEFRSWIDDSQGVTRIQLEKKTEWHANDELSSSNRIPDNGQNSTRTNLIDQTSVLKELGRK